MQIALIIILLVFICFSFVLLFGAPYLPTLKQQQKIALKLLNLKPGQMMIEPGCGDGRMLLAAAKKGILSQGYEINPILFVVAKIVTWRYKNLATVKYGNFWLQNWPKADGIYVFLLQKYMPDLNNKIIQSKLKNVKVVSYAFKIPGKELITEQKGMYLYKYK